MHWKDGMWPNARAHTVSCTVERLQRRDGRRGERQSAPARFVDNFRGPGSESGEMPCSLMRSSLTAGSPVSRTCCCAWLGLPLVSRPSCLILLTSMPQTTKPQGMLGLAYGVVRGLSRDDTRNRHLDRRSETELLRSTSREKKVKRLH